MKLSPSLLFVLFLQAVPHLAAEEYTRDQVIFFETHIRPALAEHCYRCHSKDGDSIKGGLVLDTRASTRAGGDIGPAVVPFEPESSLLLEAISYEDPDMEMPPKYQLDAKTVALFREWIEMGAPAPREAELDPSVPDGYTNTIDYETGREHWSFRPVKLPTIPESQSENPVDAFIQQSLERFQDQRMPTRSIGV